MRGRQASKLFTTWRELVETETFFRYGMKLILQAKVRDRSFPAASGYFTGASLADFYTAVDAHRTLEGLPSLASPRGQEVLAEQEKKSLEEAAREAFWTETGTGNFFNFLVLQEECSGLDYLIKDYENRWKSLHRGRGIHLASETPQLRVRLTFAQVVSPWVEAKETLALLELMELLAAYKFLLGLHLWLWTLPRRLVPARLASISPPLGTPREDANA